MTQPSSAAHAPAPPPRRSLQTFSDQISALRRVGLPEVKSDRAFAQKWATDYQKCLRELSDSLTKSVARYYDAVRMKAPADADPNDLDLYRTWQTEALKSTAAYKEQVRHLTVYLGELAKAVAEITSVHEVRPGADSVSDIEYFPDRKQRPWVQQNRDKAEYIPVEGRPIILRDRRGLHSANCNATIKEIRDRAGRKQDPASKRDADIAKFIDRMLEASRSTHV